jgi:Chaperone of endosialidase
MNTDHSSIRYKKDIIDLPDRYIDAIYKLNPVEFAFKVAPKKRVVGLIAEEVNEHLPETVVRHALDPSIIEGVQYPQLIAPLVAIIKNYKARLDAHEARLEANEAIIEKQEMMIEKLTYRLEMSETVNFRS